MISNTYIIINNKLIEKLREIPEFQMDLGQSLTAPERNKKDTRTHKFIPGDLVIQSHYTYHNDIIHKLGYLGSLVIYTDVKLDFTQIKICNAEKIKEYEIDLSLKMYDSLNKCLGNFLIEFGFIKEESFEQDIQEVDNQIVQIQKQPQSFIKTEPIKTNEYVIPKDVDDLEVGLDQSVQRPVLTNADLSNNQTSVNAEYEKIKHIPFEQLTIEQRIIYARGRK